MIFISTHLKGKIYLNWYIFLARLGFEEKRLNQGKILIKKLNNDYKKYPIIISGDFNDIPNSLVYDYIKNNQFLNFKSSYSNYNDLTVLDIVELCSKEGIKYEFYQFPEQLTE